MNAVDAVPEPHRSTLLAVLRDKAPHLLDELRSTTVPTFRQWDAVSDVMMDAMTDHFLPGHEVDETGAAIDDALGAFLTRWPGDDLPDYPYR